MKRLLSVLLILCLFPGILCAALSGSGAKDLARASGGTDHSGLLNIADPTPDQIRAKRAEQQVPDSRYSVTPSVTAPYAAGQVSDSYKEEVLRYVNYYRYIAKLPELTMRDQESMYAQYAAVLMGKLGYASHAPSRPSDMTQEFYNIAKSGAQWSNISSYSVQTEVEVNHRTWEWVEERRRSNLLRYSILFQVRDYDAAVYRELGHRRYIFSPYMQYCGYGMAETADNYRSFYVLTVANTSNPLNMELNYDVDFDYVAWPPSGNCPNDLMEATYPWSVSLNEDRYLVPALLDENGKETAVGDRTGIVITVTRESDGKVWTFNDQSPDGSAAGFRNTAYDEPYFCVDKNGHGYGPLKYALQPSGSYLVTFQSNALIFRPKFESNQKLTGIYKVHITGIKYKNGSPAELDYEVNFFNINPCTHTWGEWIDDPAPTCTVGGARTHYCTKCNEPETEAVGPLGHNWSDWEMTVPNSCTENGTWTKTCQRCGAQETRVAEATGHTWGAWTNSVDPTCTEPGSHYRLCVKCGAQDTAPIDPLGHDWDEWSETLAPSCTEEGEEKHICGRCGTEETRPIEALGHDWGEWSETLAPNCTDEGEEKHVCGRCGTEETQPIPALGHDVDNWDVLMDPNCTDPGTKIGYCSRCQQTVEEPIEPLGHDWDDGQVIMPPSAYEDGEALYTCQRCGETETRPIPMLVNPFTDVDSTKYYYKAILWAYYHDPQIASGTGDGTTFSPKKNCTREQIMTFLWNAYDAPEPETEENPFTDVKPTKYYYKPVLWAVENGITTGTSATTFGVGKECTRAQVVSFLWNAAGQPEPETTENPFTDVKTTSYYYKAVLWAVENGITTGSTPSTFNPKGTCTRGQIMTFLYYAVAGE